MREYTKDQARIITRNTYEDALNMLEGVADILGELAAKTGYDALEAEGALIVCESVIRDSLVTLCEYQQEAEREEVEAIRKEFVA